MTQRPGLGSGVRVLVYVCACVRVCEHSEVRSSKRALDAARDARVVTAHHPLAPHVRRAPDTCETVRGDL